MDRFTTAVRAVFLVLFPLAIIVSYGLDSVAWGLFVCISLALIYFGAELHDKGPRWDRVKKIEKYDYDKENFKRCPVCGKIIDYHIDSFIHLNPENIWVCGEGHSSIDVQKYIDRPLTYNEITWIDAGILVEEVT